MSEPFPKSRALIAEAIEAAIFDAFDMPPPGRTLDEITKEPTVSEKPDWKKKQGQEGKIP